MYQCNLSETELNDLFNAESEDTIALESRAIPYTPKIFNWRDWHNMRLASGYDKEENKAFFGET